MTGCSGTTLVKKLGIKAGHRVARLSLPADFLKTLGKLPDAAIVIRRPGTGIDIVLLVANRRVALTMGFITGK